MWSRTKGMTGGILACCCLVVAGLLLQMVAGPVQWEIMAWPVNIIILSVMLLFFVLAYAFRKQVYLFRYPSFRSLTAFCAGLGRKFILPSVLYRSGEDYVLEVTFPGGMRKDEVLYCVMAGEEYGGQVKIDKFDSNYLKEHGTKVIGEDAIRILQTLQ